jgi:hypothetical protein
MPEILREAFSVPNLPVTLFLGAVLLYWLLVMTGLLEAEMDAADLSAGADLDAGHAGHGAAGAPLGLPKDGFLIGCLRFMYMDRVPVMVVMSFMALFMWVISVLGNYHFNGTPGDRSSAVALALLFPNFIISALLTRIAVTPLAKLFDTMNHAQTEAEAVVGREGRVISSRVDERYGQVEIITKASPVLVNARVPTGCAPLEKGVAVLIHAAAEDHSYYLVSPLADKA